MEQHKGLLTPHFSSHEKCKANVYSVKANVIRDSHYRRFSAYAKLNPCCLKTQLKWTNWYNAVKCNVTASILNKKAQKENKLQEKKEQKIAIHTQTKMCINCV